MSKVFLDKQSEKLETIAFLSSHELRRPVANLLGLWDMLDKTNLSNQENEIIIKHIGESAHAIDTVIKNIVDSTFIKIS